MTCMKMNIEIKIDQELHACQACDVGSGDLGETNVAIYLAILCCLQCLLCACQSALNGNTCALCWPNENDIDMLYIYDLSNDATYCHMTGLSSLAFKLFYE